MTERLVVIGGDAAGMSAASQARRRRTVDQLRIDVFEMTRWVSYSACGEPYYIGGQVPTLEQLVARTPEQFRDRDIEVHLEHEVTAIDTAAHTVTVRSRSGTRTEGYDQLLYATGARPSRPPIANLDLPGVFTLSTLDDAEAIKTAASAVSSAVIVGGGYIGLEVAEAFDTLGIATTLVTSGRTILNRTLDDEMGDLATATVADRGLSIVTGHRVSCLPGADGRVAGVSCDDDRISAELVIVAVGFTPRSELAAGAGIPLGVTGAVAVDDRQRTSIDGVWAAGDCAEARHRVSGMAANLHLGTVANKQGRVAGINLGGGTAVFPGVLGTAITKYHDIEMARTGLTTAEATAAGIDAVDAVTRSTTTAGYWPSAAPMTLKVTAERGSARLLGAQIVGGPGSGKRIDVLATGIWNEMNGHEFSMMDLSYAPPFSGVWDPVLVAARAAARRATDGTST